MRLLKQLPFILGTVCMILAGFSISTDAQSVYEAQLSGSNEANPVTTAAYGTITANLNGNELSVSGTFNNLSSDLATDIAGGAHLHTGMAGESGSVAFALTANVNADNRSGSFSESENTFTLSNEQVSTLKARGMYVNIHSENYTAGELRAQLLPQSDAYYRTNLTGAFEVPAVQTKAGGALVLEVRGDSLFVSGTFSGLEGDFDASVAGGSHIHTAPAGSNGGIALSLNADVSSDLKSGTYSASENAFLLTAEQKTALMNRNFYVNIHTTTYGSGELRGQVVPAATTTLYASLSGSAEVPSVNSTGNGAVILELREGQLTASGSFADLSSDFDASVAGGAHLHTGHSGENGGVAFSLTSVTEADLRSGTFSASANSFTLTEAQVESLTDRNFYVNIHTSNNQGGELRGQVMGDARAYFRTSLSGLHEISPVESSGSGAITAEYNGDRVLLAGGFAGLDSEFDASIAGGAHLHSGAVSANGGIEFNLTTTLESGNTAGEFEAEANTFVMSETQLDDLYNGNLYANIHTMNEAGGELRGQIRTATNKFPGESGISSPEDGAMLTLSTEASTSFSAEFTEATDADGDSVAYVWQLSSDADFETLLVNSNTGSTASFSTTHGTLDTLLASAGVSAGSSATLYHRAVVTDGSNDTKGPASSVTVQRAEINASGTFKGVLNGSNEANPVTSRASGMVTATLDGNTLTLEGSFKNLSSDLATSIAGGAHIHAGMAGENGPVLFPLNVNADADLRGGTFVASENTFELSSGQVDTLMNRGLYVNIHSEQYQSGELRSQLLVESDAYYRANLSGAFEVPSVKTMATGAVNLEVKGDSLFVSGSFSGLESDFNTAVAGGSHLHIGKAGTNGSVAISLNASLNADNRSGKYLASENAFELTAEQKTALMNREVYVNIHTTGNASGELRGQVVPAASTTFFASLSGSAEIPSVNTDASGAAIIELKGDTLMLSGSFSGLESAFNAEIAGGSHLHIGHAGENGGVGFSLDADLNAELSGGVYTTESNTFVLTEAQTEALISRNMYVNIHSLQNPGGALRGQVLGEATAYFQANLNGLHEVQPVLSDAMGSAVIEYNGGNILLSGGFEGLSSAVNTDIAGGAHLHAGPVTGNGGVEIALALTLSESDTAGVFASSENSFSLTEEQTSALFSDGMYVNVHTTGFGSGEVRGQALFAPNSFPGKSSITGPADGADLDLQGSSSTEFTATWETVSDPDGQEVAYIWQLSTDAEFNNIVVNASVGSEASFTTTFGTLDTLLSDLGVELGNTATVYHRVVATDGSDETMSDPSSANIKRGTVTSNEGEETKPASFALEQNFPNPFNPSTNIKFSLAQASQAKITVYNMLGQEVAVIANQRFAAGQHSLRFDANELSSGIYIYRLQAGNKVQTRQMTLIK